MLQPPRCRRGQTGSDHNPIGLKEVQPIPGKIERSVLAVVTDNPQQSVAFDLNQANELHPVFDA